MTASLGNSPWRSRDVIVEIANSNVSDTKKNRSRNDNTYDNEDYLDTRKRSGSSMTSRGND